MKLLLVMGLIALVSCTNLPEVPNENKPEVPTATPTAQANPTPTTGELAKIKLSSRFLVHDESGCKGVPDNFDVLFFDPGTTGDDLIELKTCIKKFKAKGKIVMAYLSVGSAEEYRSDWKELSKFCNKAYSGFKDECWLDVKKSEVLAIMKKRFDNLKALGFDGAFGDNGTIYEDGKDVTLDQNAAYLSAIAGYAHSIGMYFGPNGSEKVIPKTVGVFDFYMGETISKYGGWENYSNVLGKYPVFQIVYKSGDCIAKKDAVTYYGSGLGYDSFKKYCQ